MPWNGMRLYSKHANSAEVGIGFSVSYKGEVLGSDPLCEVLRGRHYVCLFSMIEFLCAALSVLDLTL